jgi:hypothetical protein
MFVIVYGDLGEGIQGIVGLFKTEEEAENYADSHNLGHFEKHIRKIDSINENSKKPNIITDGYSPEIG